MAANGFDSFVALLALPTSVNTNQTSNAQKVRADEPTAEFRGVLQLTTANGATSPTLDATIEHSFDGNNWMTAASFTQITTATTTHEAVLPAVLGPYVRATITLGGGTNFDVTGTIWLACTAAFDAKAAA